MTANGVIVHHGMSRSVADVRTSVMLRKEAPPRSIGTWPPAAAFTQDASRNSWLVATRSAARARMRSGSQATRMPPAGT